MTDVLLVPGSGAAHGSTPRGGSQAGYAVVLAHPANLRGQAAVVLLDTISMRVKRAVRRSMAAEMASASLAVELAEFVPCSLAELFFGHFQLRAWRVWARRWATVLAIDGKNWFDALQGEGSASDERVAIEVAAIRKALLEREKRTLVRLLPGPHHLVRWQWRPRGSRVPRPVVAAGVREGARRAGPYL